LINTIVFLALWAKSGSLFMPDTESLQLFGAKDPVYIVKGEFWRFLTPMFIHIGIIHFGFNNFMLHVIGQQLEKVVGGGWFLSIYLVSGLVGNIASSVFSVHLSAGASGAIFGLLGIGFFLETSIGKRIKQATGQRPRNRVYGMTVLINLAFGFVVPFVDNAAHIGGLVAGVGMSYAMVNLRPNRIVVPRRKIGVAILVSLIVASGVGSYLASSSAFLINNLFSAAKTTDDPRHAYQLMSQVIEVDPSNKEARFSRASLLLFGRDSQRAVADLREIVDEPLYREKLTELATTLEQTGLVQEAWQLRSVLSHSN
jgi:rhomboid protease GluP